MITRVSLSRWSRRSRGSVSDGVGYYARLAQRVFQKNRLRGSEEVIMLRSVVSGSLITCLLVASAMCIPVAHGTRASESSIKGNDVFAIEIFQGQEKIVSGSEGWFHVRFKNIARSPLFVVVGAIRADSVKWESTELVEGSSVGTPHRRAPVQTCDPNVVILTIDSSTSITIPAPRQNLWVKKRA